MPPPSSPISGVGSGHWALGNPPTGDLYAALGRPQLTYAPTHPRTYSPLTYSLLTYSLLTYYAPTHLRTHPMPRCEISYPLQLEQNSNCCASDYRGVRTLRRGKLPAARSRRMANHALVSRPLYCNLCAMYDMPSCLSVAYWRLTDWPWHLAPGPLACYAPDRRFLTPIPTTDHRGIRW